MLYPTPESLPFEIKEINKQLKEYFGIDTVSNDPIWRVSWSTDQYEKRLSEYTPEGLQLLHAEVQLLPKYQHCRDRWILERLVGIPEIHESELPSQKQSYENMQTFEHARTNQMIVPTFRACRFVVDTVYAAMGKRSMRRYVDEMAANPKEVQERNIQELMNELFGDESDLLGRTITGEAVAYTGEPKIKASQE
jgi:hypothetical protein